MHTETSTLARSPGARPYTKPPWLHPRPKCPRCRRAINDGQLVIRTKTESRTYYGCKIRERRADWTITHARCPQKCPTKCPKIS